MCAIDGHDKQHPSYVDDVISGGGTALPYNLTTEELDSLGSTFYFINCWVKLFD